MPDTTVRRWLIPDLTTLLPPRASLMPAPRFTSDRRRRRPGGHASASSLLEDCQKCRLCCCCFHNDLPLLSERFFILGVIQALCGAISIVITVFAILQQVCLYSQGTGAWAGAFMMAAGLLGVVCARRKTVCAVVTLLLLSVLAAIAATLQATFSIRGLLLEVQQRCTDVGERSPPPRPGDNFRNYVIHALLLVFGLLEMGVAVTHSVLSGRLICCQPLIPVPGAARDPHLNLLGPPHVILADPAVHSALTGAGQAQERQRQSGAAFVFVMPAPTNGEPTLIFPSPPPPYSGGERQSLLYAPDSLLQPALMLSEEPPEYTTLDPRRSRPVPVNDGR